MKPAFLLAALLPLLVPAAHAQSVRSEEQAVERVAASVARHKLTRLSPECLTFTADKTPGGYTVEVREKHSPQCGGDPETAPRLFSYEIDQASGRMRIDDPVSGELRPID